MEPRVILWRPDLEQQAAALGVANQVHFLGVQSNVPRILAAADLMVLPSKTEGMPAALIEAGLAGLASVAYDVGGVGEVVEHEVSGLVVPPGELSEFSGAVMALCQDQRRRTAMGAAARQRCLEHFAMSKVARRYEELLIGLLRKQSRLPERTSDEDKVVRC